MKDTDPNLDLDLPAHEIPLGLLLDDAARSLEDHARPGLARAVRVAAAQLGGLPRGEQYVADIERVVAAAEALAEDAAPRLASAQAAQARVFIPVDPDLLADLTQAVLTCRSWGLTVERRVSNALSGLVGTLEAIRLLASPETSGLPVREQVEKLAADALDLLGFGAKEAADG